MATQYPASEGLQVAAQPGHRNSDLDGLQLSPQEVAPSLEVAMAPHSPPLEVDKRGIRVDETAQGEKEVRPGEGKLPAYPGLIDKEAAGSSGHAADTSDKKSVWRRHPRRLIAGVVVAVIIIIIAIVVPVVVTKSNNNNTAAPLAASAGGVSSSTSPSNPTATVFITTSATPSSSSDSAAPTNPISSSTAAPAASTQQPTTSSAGGSTGSSAGDSSTFQAFSDTSCGGSGSTGGTGNFDGTCQKAPASGAVKVTKVHNGCQMTVYSDSFCSVDGTLAPVGVCAAAKGKNVASYSIDCSAQRPVLR